MSEYRHGSHTCFSIHLHLGWITKYRKPVLVGDVGLRVRDLIREICRNENVEIIKGHCVEGSCAPVCLDDQDFRVEGEEA